MPGSYKCEYKWTSDEGCKNHICGTAFGMPVANKHGHEHKCRNRNCRESIWVR